MVASVYDTQTFDAHRDQIQQFLLFTVQGQIIEMTDETIKDVISKGVTFVKYFIPGCGFCKRMERAWEKLGNMDFSQASGPVTLAEMNCDIYPDACRANGVIIQSSLFKFIRV